MVKYGWFALVFILLIACKKENGKVNGCNVENLTITTLECTSYTTYSLKIDFDHKGFEGQYFDVYVRNNELIGYYAIDSLPIILPDFERSGKEYDLIKICINDRPDCCLVEDFLPPNCNDVNYEIAEIIITIGECTTDSTYRLTVDFDDSNLPSNASFNLYARNNKLIGNYSVASLPIIISDFQWSGNVEDYFKICLEGYPDICQELEFYPPTCLFERCDINDLKIVQGACTSDSTYALTIDFKVNSPTQSSFDLYDRDGVLIGYYKLNDLPLTISNFNESSTIEDSIKVCINDNFDCCKVLEFITKDCK